MDPNFQERIKYAVERVGSQAKLARRIRETYNKPCTTQAIQFLQSETNKKPAKSSGLVPLIAGVAGLRAEWLASGKGPRHEPPPIGHGVENTATHLELGPVEIKVKETGQRIWMELTQKAIEVAAMYMKLNEKEQGPFYRALKTEFERHVDLGPVPGEHARIFAPSAAKKVLTMKPKTVR